MLFVVSIDKYVCSHCLISCLCEWMIPLPIYSRLPVLCKLFVSGRWALRIFPNVFDVFWNRACAVSWQTIANFLRFRLSVWYSKSSEKPFRKVSNDLRGILSVRCCLILSRIMLTKMLRGFSHGWEMVSFYWLFSHKSRERECDDRQILLRCHSYVNLV